ncbi:hypothetical protein GCM10009599_14350 [Luteococcus peritonei]
MDGLDLLLVSDALREWCIRHGLDAPRVAGLLASGRTLMPGMPAEIYAVPRQEMTASDLARLSREASEVLGWECLLWCAMPGEENLLPGERVTYL